MILNYVGMADQIYWQNDASRSFDDIVGNKNLMFSLEG